MGNSSKNPQDYQVVSSYDHRQWSMKQQLTYCQIWNNDLLGFSAEVYELQLNLSTQELDKYTFRSQNNRDIVGVYHVIPEENQFLCAKGQMMHVLTQRIPMRLHNIYNLNQSEALHILTSAYSGYNTIGSHYGPVMPDQNSIGFTELGKAKVWVNSNLALNTPFHRQQITDSEKLQKRNQHYVKQIFNMVEKKTVGGLPRLRDIFSKKQPTYFEALNILEHYTQTIGIKVPTRIRHQHMTGSATLNNHNNPTNVFYPSKSRVKWVEADRSQQVYQNSPNTISFQHFLSPQEYTTIHQQSLREDQNQFSVGKHQNWPLTFYHQQSQRRSHYEPARSATVAKRVDIQPRLNFQSRVQSQSNSESKIQQRLFNDTRRTKVRQTSVPARTYEAVFRVQPPSQPIIKSKLIIISPQQQRTNSEQLRRNPIHFVEGARVDKLTRQIHPQIIGNSSPIISVQKHVPNPAREPAIEPQIQEQDKYKVNQYLGQIGDKKVQRGLLQRDRGEDQHQQSQPQSGLESGASINPQKNFIEQKNGPLPIFKIPPVVHIANQHTFSSIQQRPGSIFVRNHNFSHIPVHISHKTSFLAPNTVMRENQFGKNSGYNLYNHRQHFDQPYEVPMQDKSISQQKINQAVGQRPKPLSWESQQPQSHPYQGTKQILPQESKSKQKDQVQSNNGMGLQYHQNSKNQIQIQEQVKMGFQQMNVEKNQNTKQYQQDGDRPAQMNHNHLKHLYSLQEEHRSRHEPEDDTNYENNQLHDQDKHQSHNNSQEGNVQDINLQEKFIYNQFTTQINRQPAKERSTNEDISTLQRRNQQSNYPVPSKTPQIPIKDQQYKDQSYNYASQAKSYAQEYPQGFYQNYQNRQMDQRRTRHQQDHMYRSQNRPRSPQHESPSRIQQRERQEKEGLEREQSPRSYTSSRSKNSQLQIARLERQREKLEKQRQQLEELRNKQKQFWEIQQQALNRQRADQQSNKNQKGHSDSGQEYYRNKDHQKKQETKNKERQGSEDTRAKEREDRNRKVREEMRSLYIGQDFDGNTLQEPLAHFNTKPIRYQNSRYTEVNQSPYNYNMASTSGIHSYQSANSTILQQETSDRKIQQQSSGVSWNRQASHEPKPVIPQSYDVQDIEQYIRKKYNIKSQSSVPQVSTSYVSSYFPEPKHTYQAKMIDSHESSKGDDQIGRHNLLTFMPKDRQRDMFIVQANRRTNESQKNTEEEGFNVRNMERNLLKFQESRRSKNQQPIIATQSQTIMENSRKDKYAFKKTYQQSYRGEQNPVQTTQKSNFEERLQAYEVNKDYGKSYDYKKELDKYKGNSSIQEKYQKYIESKENVRSSRVQIKQLDNYEPIRRKKQSSQKESIKEQSREYQKRTRNRNRFEKYTRASRLDRNANVEDDDSQNRQLQDQNNTGDFGNRKGTHEKLTYEELRDMLWS